MEGAVETAGASVDVAVGERGRSDLRVVIALPILHIPQSTELEMKVSLETSSEHEETRGIQVKGERVFPIDT